MAKESMTDRRKPSDEKPTKGPTKRVNFYIPTDQYGGLARLAGAKTAEKGERVTMTDLIVEAVGEFLDRNGA